MLRLTDTIDLVRRRTNGCLGPDGMDVVYVKFSEDMETASLIFIMKDDIPAEQMTKIAVRYQHLLFDYLDSYSIKVLPATNYFRKDSDTWSIWTCRDEFNL